MKPILKQQFATSRRWKLLMASAAISGPCASLHAGENQGTGFVYQGELRQAGALISGVYDLRFALFADAAGTVQVGPSLCFDDVPISDGRVMRTLDFGAAFGPDKRYLAVLVRQDTAGAAACATLGGYTSLGPLSPIEAAPSAHFALRADTAATVVNADSTSATVADAQNLGGRPAGYYTSAANVAGVLPSGMLTGVFASPVTLSNPANVLTGDGSGITGIPGATAHAAHANTATSATSALDATRLANQLPSHYLNIGNHTTPFNRDLLEGTYTSQVQFGNSSNFFAGSGAGLFSLNATSQMVAGTIPSGRISGAYTGLLAFNNPANFFHGDGTGLTDLRLVQVIAPLRPENMPQMSRVISRQANTGVWSGTNPISNTYAVIPNSAQTVGDISFSGQAIMHWSFSAGTGTAQTGFHIVPMIDGVQTQQTMSTPMFFNTAGVHQFVGGTTTFPVSAGSHTFALGYRKSAGTGNLETSSDSIQYSIIITR